MVFDLIPNLFASIISILFPIFASYKALRTSDPAQLSPWLMYWISFALLTLVETNFSLLLMFVPFYSLLRLVFLFYLILPQTQGARVLYQTRIHPFLAEREARIEALIEKIHAQLKANGLDYIVAAIAWVQRVLLRTTPSAAATSSPSKQASESYAASLLARFNLPSAREGFAAPAGDFYGMLSAAASTLTKGVAAGGAADRSVSAQAEGILAKNGGLVPAHITDPREKATFLAQQREKLRVVLGALDRQQVELEMPESENPVTRVKNAASGAEGISRTKSEASFERIDKDEATETTKDGAGGWFEWLGGKGGGKGEAREDGETRAQSSAVDAGL